MVIRRVGPDDVERFFHMLCRLDEETEYMLYEPGERRARTPNLDRLRANVEAASTGGDCLLAAVDDGGDLQGFIWAERGRLNRVKHTAYIVVGIRAACRGQGVGTAFFRRVEDWARASGVVRLELTVECANTAALRLYERRGFRVEGTREKAMKVGGEFVDEYYMAKILE